LDLRERVLRTVEGGTSRNAAAAQFGLGISTAIKWLQRVRATGSARPGKMGGHKPSAPARAVAVGALPGAGLHAARPGGRARRARAQGRLPFGMGVCPRRGLTYKKRRWSRASASARCRAPARAVAEVPAAGRPLPAGLFAKRLERGRFLWPQAKDGSVRLTPAQLSMLLEGIDWRAPRRTWAPEAAG